MKKTKDKISKLVPITTNKVDYEIDYAAFKKKYNIFRYRVKQDNRWFSAYEISRSMPEDVCLSVTARKERVDDEQQTWYYILVPADRKEEVFKQLDNADEEKVELCEFRIHECDETDNLILNLLLNTCTLSTDECRSHRDFGKLLLVREDSFMTDPKKIKQLNGDRLGLEVHINRDFVMVASTVSFSPVKLDENPDKKVNIPPHYYCFDHLQMTLYKELPENWEEMFNDGFIHFYQRGSSNPFVHHVIPQLNMNLSFLHLNKTGVIYQLRDGMKANYSDVLNRFEFKVVEETDKLKTDYENVAKSIIRSVLNGQTLRVEDTVGTKESCELADQIKYTVKDLSWLDKKLSLSLKESQQADSVIRIVRETKEDIEKAYHLLDRVNMVNQGVAVQHIQVKKDYSLKDALKNPIGRIIKELTVKRMLSTRSLIDAELKELYAGWSFAVCKKVDDNRLINLMMHVDENGNLHFGRTRPGDFVGRKGLHHANLLDAGRDEELWQYFGIDNYIGQETYCLLSKGNNVYHILYTTEQALPEYDALKEFYSIVRNLEQWEMEVIDDMVASMEGYDEHLSERIAKEKKYTVESLRSLAKKIRELYPVISKALSDLVDGMPYLSQLRRVEHVDNYFGGLVDIHCWLDRKILKYVSSEYGGSLNQINGISYNGFPHVRAVVVHKINKEESVANDFNEILQMLQTGFGKAHFATALPFGFKLLKEMCDILCVAQYGIHWQQMNPTSFKEWEGRFYKGKGILLDESQSTSC